MNKSLVALVVCSFVGLLGVVSCSQVSGDATSDLLQQQPAEGEVPIFEVDPTWPKQLPNNWIVGVVSGVYVDDQDHVWIVQRAGSVNTTEGAAATDPPAAACCLPAPPVLEFDQDGRVVQGWGGPSAEYDWPESEHGIYLDEEDHVWVVGNDDTGGRVLKFTRDGRFLLQIGGEGTGGGSNDTVSFGRPAQAWVDHESSEVFVADGELNRRVIVFDTETGVYKRHWGGHGEEPDDSAPWGVTPDGWPSGQFGPGGVHGLAISRDKKVYVTDRNNNRIQVFRTDGTFLEEVLVAPWTRGVGSAFAFAFSPDPDQRFLYMADGTNQRVWILSRDQLEVLAWFGHPGRNVGQFLRAHDIAVDSGGHLFVAEANEGRRIQRFSFKGFGPAAYYD